MFGCLLGLVLVGGAMAADLEIHDAYSPLNRQRPVRSQTTLIVLHTTEGGDSSAQREVRRRGLANYLVLRSGRILRVISKGREARHAGTSMWQGVKDLDRRSVGIEVVGHHNRPITGAQERSLRDLIAELQRIYGLDDDAVVPHSMVAYGHPNRWHKKAHRGRKRCAMQFADPALRERLGLTSRPSFDPDVRAGRLVEADPELAAALFGRRIGPGQTAAEVVGDAYRSASTIYLFPTGKRVRGNQVRNWANIPAGTWVLVNQR